MIAHVAAAHWWGPAGWLYRNTPGNLAASLIAFAAGYLLKGRQVVRGFHRKLDANHAELLEAHQVTRRSMNRPEAQQ